MTPRFTVEVGGVAAWIALQQQPNNNCLHTALADKDEVSTLHVAEDGSLSHQQTFPSGGLTPVHLHVIQNRILLVANYHGPDDTSGPGGSVASFLIDSDCGLTLVDSIPHSGSSVDPTRQNTAHPHSIVAQEPEDGKDSVFAFVCDLGMDTIFTYVVDLKTAHLKEAARFVTAPGSGPRHSAIDAKRGVLYVVHEMGNFISSLSIQPDGSLQLSRSAYTLPSGFTNFSKAAEIVLFDDFVFATNRGANTIASFAPDLTKAWEGSSGGSYPRGLNLVQSGEAAYWFVANQDSSSLALFAAAGSSLVYSGLNVSAPNPVTVAFFQIPAHC